MLLFPLKRDASAWKCKNGPQVNEMKAHFKSHIFHTSDAIYICKPATGRKYS
jgi:hypothetical protein